MAWLPYLTMTFLMLVGLFLIFIVLLQRGRGGGLAGALGGMGGTSAFGTRAGDVFTKITVGVAIVWTVLAAVNVWVLGMNTTRYEPGAEGVPTAPAVGVGPDGKTPENSLPEDSKPSTPPTDDKTSDTKPEPETFKGDTATPAAGDATTPAESPAKSDAESTEKSEPK
jgi:preprotein translocase subunit SecG